MCATDLYVACAMVKVNNQGFDVPRNPECVPSITWGNPMPGIARANMGVGRISMIGGNPMHGGARSNMSLGRVSMFGENPMPGGARSNMGLSRVTAVLALMKSANWCSSALTMNAWLAVACHVRDTIGTQGSAA